MCRASSGRSDHLSILNTTSSASITNFVPLLNNPVLVTGALLISNGQCSLTSALQVLISTEDAELREYCNHNNDLLAYTNVYS